MDREYYLHFAGHKEEFEIEPIYERHAGLFEREVVERLRERRRRRRAGDERAALRYLLELAVGGFIGRETKEQETALAEREAALEIEVDGRREPYRQAAIVQANEPDPDRRAAIEEARLEAARAELNPLHLSVIERSHELARELGWPSYRAMCEELKQRRPRGARAADRARSRRRPPTRYRPSGRAAAARADRLRLRPAAPLRPALLLPRAELRRRCSRPSG